ncbi:hypothetical protein CPB83DRAFT_851365 [Crepidotus variabilis]|uniref:DNA helicase n=1 Tax=Crepidotus variabilis TaxID=179855 RepID=A0A9P6EJN4_9AGAR|nr:hypothetical protein CPB83DRAFT_851365 [Crepidotus variabilis]
MDASRSDNSSGFYNGSMERRGSYYIPQYRSQQMKRETLQGYRKSKIYCMDSKRTGKLTDRVEIAIGMKIMVVLNVATEANIANGTRGTITDIILDPRD